MSWIPTKLFYLASWLHIMVSNCPKYDNMSYCVQFFRDIPMYIEDYQRFQTDKDEYLAPHFDKNL